MILPHRRHTGCPSPTPIAQVNLFARLTRNCPGEMWSGFMLNPTVHIITTVQINGATLCVYKWRCVKIISRGTKPSSEVTAGWSVRYQHKIWESFIVFISLSVWETIAVSNGGMREGNTKGDILFPGRIWIKLKIGQNSLVRAGIRTRDFQNKKHKCCPVDSTVWSGLVQ